jgi:hypothetical protein
MGVAQVCKVVCAYLLGVGMALAVGGYFFAYIPYQLAGVPLSLRIALPLLAVIYVPLGRVLLAPLALSWNRHR